MYDFGPVLYRWEFQSQPFSEQGNKDKHVHNLLKRTLIHNSIRDTIIKIQISGI